MSDRDWERCVRAGVSAARLALTIPLRLDAVEDALNRAERRMEARRRAQAGRLRLSAGGGTLPDSGRLMTALLEREGRYRSNYGHRLRA